MVRELSEIGSETLDVKTKSEAPETNPKAEIENPKKAE
jgi:hypothetical protein